MVSQTRDLSFALLWKFLESLVVAGVSSIVEANFRPNDSQRFQELQRRHPLRNYKSIALQGRR